MDVSTNNRQQRPPSKWSDSGPLNKYFSTLGGCEKNCQPPLAGQTLWSVNNDIEEFFLSLLLVIHIEYRNSITVTRRSILLLRRVTVKLFKAVQRYLHGRHLVTRHLVDPHFWSMSKTKWSHSPSLHHQSPFILAEYVWTKIDLKRPHQGDC